MHGTTQPSVFKALLTLPPPGDAAQVDIFLERDTRQITLFYDAVSKIARIFCAQRKENGRAGYENAERALEKC